MTEPSKQAAAGGSAEPDRRAAIRASLEAGTVKAAIQAARALVLEQPSLPNFRFLRQLVDGLPRDGGIGLKPYKVAT